MRLLCAVLKFSEGTTSKYNFFQPAVSFLLRVETNITNTSNSNLSKPSCIQQLQFYVATKKITKTPLPLDTFTPCQIVLTYNWHTSFNTNEIVNATVEQKGLYLQFFFKQQNTTCHAYVTKWNNFEVSLSIAIKVDNIQRWSSTQQLLKRLGALIRERKSMIDLTTCDNSKFVHNSHGSYNCCIQVPLFVYAPDIWDS